MFVVLLNYTAPLDEIDARMPDHMAFVHECFRAGVFLVAGRQDPRVGGLILARSPKKDDLKTVMRSDPFVAEGLATFEIVEFRSSFHHPAFAPFADRGTRTVRGVPEG